MSPPLPDLSPVTLAIGILRASLVLSDVWCILEHSLWEVIIQYCYADTTCLQ
jgi:hypothetical protein